MASKTMAKCVRLFCLIALVIFSKVKDNNEDENELIAVVQIIRHGERTPYAFYTTDPYSNSSYWNGLKAAELTNKGKRQLYELGQFTKSRFSNFLPKAYDKNIVRATATDFDRNLMSAQCFLFGLFQTTGNQVWQDNIYWQPIPLHEGDPNIIYAEPSQCPNYVPLVKDVWNTKEYIAINEKYKDVFRYLSNTTGDNITDVRSTFRVFDCLNVEHSVGLKLPKWTTAIYPEPLGIIQGYHYKSFTGTTKLKQLWVGRFFHQILEYFSGMSNTTSFSQKYQIYILHDSNIAAILNTFGAFDPPYVPTFASSLWMELRKHDNNYYINNYIKNNDHIKQISVGRCEIDCSLEKFVEYLKEFIVDADDWNTICAT